MALILNLDWDRVYTSENAGIRRIVVWEMLRLKRLLRVLVTMPEGSPEHEQAFIAARSILGIDGAGEEDHGNR